MFANHQWRWIIVMILSTTALLGACSGDDGDDNAVPQGPADVTAYKTCQDAAGSQACENPDVGLAFYVWGDKLPDDVPTYLSFMGESQAEVNETILTACLAATGSIDSEGFAASDAWQNSLRLKHGDDANPEEVYNQIVEDFCPNAEQDLADAAE